MPGATSNFERKMDALGSEASLGVMPLPMVAERCTRRNPTAICDGGPAFIDVAALGVLAKEMRTTGFEW